MYSQEKMQRKQKKSNKQASNTYLTKLCPMSNDSLRSWRGRESSL